MLKIETGTVCTNSYPHNHFSLDSDQYPFSPDNSTAWSVIELMRINETDQQLWNFLMILTNPLKQYHKKCMK